MEGTDHAGWKNLCLEGKHCQSLYIVFVVCGIFFFLMEFSEGVRVGESGCLRYDTLQSWCFCFNISDL